MFDIANNFLIALVIIAGGVLVLGGLFALAEKVIRRDPPQT